MIPKIIYYCWFGKQKKPKSVIKCINTWKKFPDYQIIELNEDNCDIGINEYVTKAYADKAWAYVSDYFRLKVLYENGGIYFDTDVKMFKDFNIFLNEKMFIGFMFDCTLGTAVIGAEKNHEIVKNLLSLYDTLEFSRSPNNDLYTKFFLDKYKLKLNNTLQKYDIFTVYPKEYFECPTYDIDKGYSAHYFMGSWYKRTLWQKLKRSFYLFYLGEVEHHKRSRKKCIPLTPWYKTYLEDIKK